MHAELYGGLPRPHDRRLPTHPHMASKRGVERASAAYLGNRKPTRACSRARVSYIATARACWQLGKQLNVSARRAGLGAGRRAAVKAVMS